MPLTENSGQVFLPGGCNRTQNLRFGPYTKRERDKERETESITGSCSEQCSRANTIKCGVEKIFENLTQQICFDK